MGTIAKILAFCVVMYFALPYLFLMLGATALADAWLCFSDACKIGEIYGYDWQAGPKTPIPGYVHNP